MRGQPPGAARPENLVLIAAASFDGRPAPPSAACDWDYVLRAAEAQGVAPLVHGWLTRHPDRAAPSTAAARLHSDYWKAHFRNRVLSTVCREVCTAAASVGVPIMPLKGARLLPYYPTAALRPLSDIDVLVRPEDRKAFDRVLTRLGYAESTPHPAYVDQDTLDAWSQEHHWIAPRNGVHVTIEYRCEPLEPTAGNLSHVDPRYLELLRQHTHDIWLRAAVEGGDSPGAWMRREDLLLHVAIHLAAKHVNLRLLWVHDLGRVIMAEPNLAWDEVVRGARELRVHVPVGAALRAAREWLGVPVPAEVLAALADSPGGWLDRWERGQFDRLLSSVATRDLSTDGPAIWPLGSALARLRGWRPRARAIRSVAFPSHAYLRSRLYVAPGRLARLQAAVRRLSRRRS